MKNQAVAVAVDRVVYWAVYRNVDVNRDVDVALDVAMNQAWYTAVAPHKEPPPPGLGLYLGGVT